MRSSIGKPKQKLNSSELSLKDSYSIFMKTQFIETFLLTVETGSMAEAARRLNITAAAVAQQIHRLEKELGVVLVSRAGKTVRPSAAGQRILERARSLLRDSANLKALAIQDELHGELRLGSINTALNFLLPEVLSQLISRYPDLKIHIHSALSSPLFDAVQSGELDAAICLHPLFSLPKTCRWQLLREEKLVLLTPAPWADQDPHALLADRPFIRYDRKQWGGQQAENYLRKVGVEPKDRVELSHLAAIFALVSRELGVAIVPDVIMPASLSRNIVKLPLPLAIEPRQLGIVWQRACVNEKLVLEFVRQAKAFRLPV
jgi:DNA-binding transcriptional LysR family regulator